MHQGDFNMTYFLHVFARLLFLLPIFLLISCGGSSSSVSETSGNCTLTSSPFPVTEASISDAPSQKEILYAAIYELAAKTAADSNPPVSNPLTVTPLQSLVGDNRYYAAAVSAYVWGLPVEQFWEKQGYYFTNNNPPIPVNSLYLANTINTGTSIVSPNTSVLYANGFVDLSVNPYLVTYPQSSIYNVLQIMDAYTNVQGSVGSRVNTCGSVVLYYANASYASAVRAAYPNNSIAIYTPQAWLLGRVAVDSYAVPTESGTPQTLYQMLYGTASSALALWKSQNVLKQYTLSALTKYTNTNGGSVQQSSAPSTDQYASSSTQFYTNLAAAVGQNQFLVNYAGVQNGVLNMTSSVVDQSAMFSNFSMIGLTSGSFDTSGLTTAQKDKISAAYADAYAAINLIASASNNSASTNYWTISNTLGQYSPKYLGWITAAAVAQVGLGANLAADGAYPQVMKDSGGQILTGASGNSYSLNFSSTGIPPITTNNGFWSVTIYDSNNNLYSSTTNSYYYTSQVGGVYALGSIQLASAGGIPTLYFQNSVPTNSERLPYWIPVPADNFTVLMRLYNPVAANTNGVSTILNPYNDISSASSPQWIPPAVVKN
jgi:hypothetical protein